MLEQEATSADQMREALRHSGGDKEMVAARMKGRFPHVLCRRDVLCLSRWVIIFALVYRMSKSCPHAVVGVACSQYSPEWPFADVEEYRSGMEQ